MGPGVSPITPRSAGLDPLIRDQAGAKDAKCMAGVLQDKPGTGYGEMGATLLRFTFVVGT
jgi:hypothetical protein